MGQADAVAIVPDRVDTEPLGCHDLPFRVVADHPGLVRADSEHFHRMLIGPLFGLTETVLVLDLDVVETVFESEPHDLRALRLGCAVGDQRELDAQLLQPVKGFVRVRGSINNSSSCRAL